MHAAIAACAHRFAETHDLYEIIRDAVLIIRDHIGLDRAGIYFYDEAAECFTGAYGTDQDGGLRDERKLVMTDEPKNPMRRALAGEGEEFFIEDFEREMPNDSFMKGVKNHFFILLKAHDHILGAISVDNLLTQRPIDQSVREDLRRFARYIALAIENFNLREDILRKNRALLRELENSNRLLDDLDAANAELKDFAYIVSHDLKAPLRGISSLAKWLMEDYGDGMAEEGRLKLKQMVDRTHRMNDLIEGVLRYSRVGRVQAHRERMDMVEVLEHVVSGLSVPDTVRVRVEGTLPTLEWDRTQLEQVLQNLIGNAVVHLGKPSGEVVVSCRPVLDRWECCVRDNGVGIDESQLAHIFKIFNTGNRRESEGGTGIGLAIVKKIVECHGGAVRVESVPGEGSAFFFTIPRYDVESEGGSS